MDINKLPCFKCYCEDKLEPIGKDYFMFAVDRPYYNLFFHKSCYLEVKGYVEEFVLNNQEKIEKYLQKRIKMP